MASSVGSYVLGNQMRGRAIRAMKSNPDKTSNIWHLVCMTDRREACELTEDFRTLQRRMMGFVGVSYDGTVIEKRYGAFKYYFSAVYLQTISWKSMKI